MCMYGKGTIIWKLYNFCLGILVDFGALKCKFYAELHSDKNILFNQKDADGEDWKNFFEEVCIQELGEKEYDRRKRAQKDLFAVRQCVLTIYIHLAGWHCMFNINMVHVGYW